MKLMIFNDYRLGVLTDAGVVDVSSTVADIPWIHPQDMMNGLIERWQTYSPRLEEESTHGVAVAAEEVTIRPPLPRPSNIVCMAVNYLEENVPEPLPINAFHKSPHSVIGSGEVMRLPDVPGTAFEAEAELGVVMGSWTDNVSAESALDHIFGYVNLIDGSVRGLPPLTNCFYQMKSRATFCPIGPVIVTADEIPNPHDLDIRLWNGSDLMQEFNTRDMAHRIDRSIEFVSACHPLGPGDLLATGTNHQGLHPLMDGDELVLEISGLGRLETTIADPLQRRWERQTRRERRLAGLEGLAPQTSGKYSA